MDLTPDSERIAEAAAFDRIHGDDAADVIAGRIIALVLAGDIAGAELWRGLEAALCTLRDNSHKAGQGRQCNRADGR